MPEIHAFHGLRYDLGHVGTLSDVIAPPYDVIDDKLQDALYKKHPANVIRLILNRAEPGDDDASNRYTRAAGFLKNWRRQGVLQRDDPAAVYVYHQVFNYGGREFTRRGFMARVRLEPFGEGQIYPHEETHASAKADRLKLTQACKANLSQIFGIYPDEQNRAQSILESATAGKIPLEATDHLGVVHRMWLVTDEKVIGDAAAAMAGKPVFIADGHHRYETACNYRQQLAAGGDLSPQHPANFVLMMCISMFDPGMIVLPTHRLFRGLPAMSASDLARKLGDCFSLEAAGKGPNQAHQVWEAIEEGQEQSSIGFYAAKDDSWQIATLSEAGEKRMAEVAADHSADWQSLGVSILQRLVLETLLDARDLPKPHYVHLVEEVVDALTHGDPEGGPRFELAALVMPASLDHIRAVSQHGERMPAKSTYFYPKLLSGLVINPLE
jgi:uncharacterized protein (DUF1015 family)